MADQEASAAAVRKNMERLRALRMAKEAEEAARAPATASPGKKKKAGAKSSKTKAPQLSEWLASQKDTGRAS